MARLPLQLVVPSAIKALVLALWTAIEVSFSFGEGVEEETAGQWTGDAAHGHVLLLDKILPQLAVLHFKLLLAIWRHPADILIVEDLQQFD